MGDFGVEEGFHQAPCALLAAVSVHWHPEICPLARGFWNLLATPGAALFAGCLRL